MDPSVIQGPVGYITYTTLIQKIKQFFYKWSFTIMLEAYKQMQRENTYWDLERCYKLTDNYATIAIVLSKKYQGIIMNTTLTRIPAKTRWQVTTIFQSSAAIPTQKGDFQDRTDEQTDQERELRGDGKQDPGAGGGKRRTPPARATHPHKDGHQN